MHPDCWNPARDWPGKSCQGQGFLVSPRMFPSPTPLSACGNFLIFSALVIAPTAVFITLETQWHGRTQHTHTHTPVLKTDLMSWSGFRFTGKLSGSAETSPLLGPALPRATCVQGAQGCGSLRGLPAPGVWTPLCFPAPLLDRQLFPSAQVPVQS